jgi:hypothetical protein
MSIYIGYPITYETACELFRVEDNVEKRIKDAGLELHSTDKGQCILGLRIHESEGTLWHFKNADEIIILILRYRKKFVELVKQSEICTSSFTFYEKEGDFISVSNPEPCVFVY